MTITTGIDNRWASHSGAPATRRAQLVSRLVSAMSGLHRSRLAFVEPELYLLLRASLTRFGISQGLPAPSRLSTGTLSPFSDKLRRHRAILAPRLDVLCVMLCHRVILDPCARSLDGTRTATPCVERMNASVPCRARQDSRLVSVMSGLHRSRLIFVNPGLRVLRRVPVAHVAVPEISSRRSGSPQPRQAPSRASCGLIRRSSRSALTFSVRGYRVTLPCGQEA